MKLKRRSLLLAPVILLGGFYVGNALSGHRIAYKLLNFPGFLLG
jgi:hypothetical protein